MSETDVVWFKSKVDLWLGCILLTVPVIEVWVLISALLRGDSEGSAAGIIGCGIVAGIYALLVLPVRFGVVRQRIRFDAIQRVYPTHSPLSSPALSLDRLAISTGRGPFRLTLISPNDRDEFVRLLVAGAGLVPTGDGWAGKGSPL